MNQSDQTECINAWIDVLKHFKMFRAMIPGEDVIIGRAVHRYGKDNILLAFLGAKHEPSSESFNPAYHLSLQRILHHEKINRFINLGALHRAKSYEAGRFLKEVKKEEEPEVPMSQEEKQAVKDKLAKLGIRLGSE